MILPAHPRPRSHEDGPLQAHSPWESVNYAFWLGALWGTVWAASVVTTVAGGNLRWAAGGGGGSLSMFWNSSVTSRVDFLNSLMLWPRPRASSGNFFGPKR